jgi:hypothetical protein
VGHATHHAFRLGVGGGTAGLLAGRGGGSGGEVASHDKVGNDAMARNALALARAVERKLRCRVVRLGTEFVSDAATGRVWLHRVTECLTAVDGPAQRQRPEEEQRLSRVAVSMAVGQALTVDTKPDTGGGEKTGGSGGSKDGASGGTYGVSVKAGRGSNSEVRAARRRAREPVPDDEAVAKVLAELEEREYVAKVVTVDSLKKTSTSDVRALARSSAASKALGSSQLNGCPGDFCDYDVAADVKALDGPQVHGGV